MAHKWKDIKKKFEEQKAQGIKDVLTARRCVDSCAAYLLNRDDSPLAARDLRESVRLLEREAWERGRRELVAEVLV